MLLLNYSEKIQQNSPSLLFFLRRHAKRSGCCRSSRSSSKTLRRRGRASAGYVKALAMSAAPTGTICSFLPSCPHQKQPSPPLALCPKGRSHRSLSKWWVALRRMTRTKLMHQSQKHQQENLLLRRASPIPFLCSKTVWPWTIYCNPLLGQMWLPLYSNEWFSASYWSLKLTRTLVRFPSLYF